MRAVDATLACLKRAGVNAIFGLPGGPVIPLFDALHRRSGHPDLPGAPRAGCRPHGRRVREGHRAGRRVHGHLGAGGDQPRDPDRRRLHGLGAAGGDHRPGRLHAGGHRRLPGGRHRRHHPADREALLPDQGRRGPAARRWPRPSTWPRPAAPARCWWTSAWTSGRARSRTSTTPSRRCPATGPRPARATRASWRPPRAPWPAAERPVIYAGGGIITGEASAELTRAVRGDRHPGQHHPDGPRRLPRHPPAVRGHARHARHRRRHLRLPGVATRSWPWACASTSGSCPPS